MSRKPIFTSSSILLCSILSATAWADGHSPTEAKQPLKLKDVTVTGTKEGEVKLQEVPAAISAYTEEDMSDAGIGNIKDLRMQTPGLNLTHNGQSARLYMRGIGSNLDFIGSDPSVTVHVDGVYQSRTTSILEDFLDVERVEILRGPQGTLYGRNSTGGTINLITKKPEAESSGKLFAEVGSYSFRSVGGMINGTISEDKVLGRLAVVKTDHDPYVKNTAATGVDGLLDDDSLATRGALRFLLDDKSELVLRADYSDIDRNPAAYKTTLVNSDGAAGTLAAGAIVPSDPWSVNVNDVDPYTESKNYGASIEYTRKISPELTLVSLTGYRDLDLKLKEDTDGSDVVYLVTEYEEQQNMLSEELRLQYQGDRLKWVAGAYYLQEEHESDTAINSTIVVVDSKHETQAYALFGQGTYSITDRLNTTLGLRYSSEEKEFDNVYDHADPTLDFSASPSNSWDSWSPSFSLDYTYDSGTMVYSSVKRGFKSGGYNMTDASPEYSPEKVWSYEIGSKFQLLDKKLHSNIALFYSDYQDLQVSEFTSPGVLNVSNAAEANIFGLEIENKWMPTYNLAIEMNYAFLNAEYDNYIIPPVVNADSSIAQPEQDASGDDMVASPAHKVSLAGQYFHDLPSGTLSYRLEYAWQDEQYFTAPNHETSYQGAYALVNARFGYESADEMWEAEVYVENLTNKAYSTSTREFPGSPLSLDSVGVTKDINPPRTFGLRLVRNF